MIGGVDVVLQNYSLAAPAVLETVARAVHQRWPEAVFVDAVSGHQFASFAAARFGDLRELFVFRDEASRASWEHLGLTDENADAAIHAIAEPHAITLVVSDPDEPVVHALIGELDQLLKYGVPNGSWGEDAAA
jgi:hypothetical protein